MKRRNKILIIALVIFVIIIAASLFLQYVQNNKNEKNLEQGLQNVENRQFATVESDHIKEVIADSLDFPSFSTDQKNINFVSTNSNSLFLYNLDTKKGINLVPLLNFDPIIFTSWSEDQKKAIVITQKETEISKNYLVNLETKQKTDLPDSYSSEVWQANDKIIAYNFEANVANEIISKDINSQETSKLIQFQDIGNQYSVDLIYANSEKVYYLISQDSAVGTKNLYEINLQTLQNNLISENVIQAKVDDNSIITSKYIDGNTKFYLSDLNGQNEKVLNVEVNSINSILKKGNNIYWIKTNTEESNGNLGIGYTFIQTINLYNLENNTSSELLNIEKEGNYSSSLFYLSSDESKLYFVNSANSFLYSINLK